MVNDVPAVRAEIHSAEGAVTVPSDCAVRKMRELAVTAVLLTVTVPATKVPTPILALVPSLICMPIPAVPATKLPPVRSVMPDEVHWNRAVLLEYAVGVLPVGTENPLVTLEVPVRTRRSTDTAPLNVAVPVNGKV